MTLLLLGVVGGVVPAYGWFLAVTVVAFYLPRCTDHFVPHPHTRLQNPIYVYPGLPPRAALPFSSLLNCVCCGTLLTAVAPPQFWRITLQQITISGVTLFLPCTCLTCRWIRLPEHSAITALASVRFNTGYLRHFTHRRTHQHILFNLLFYFQFANVIGQYILQI